MRRELQYCTYRNERYGKSQRSTCACPSYGEPRYSQIDNGAYGSVYHYKQCGSTEWQCKPCFIEHGDYPAFLAVGSRHEEQDGLHERRVVKPCGCGKYHHGS